jgi:hypothetical protein
MLWLIVIASGIGILLGLWLRVLVLGVASAAIVLTSLVLMPFGQWSQMAGAVFTVALLCSLQCGYVVGALLSSSCTRVNSRRTADLPPRRSRSHESSRQPP